VATTCPVCKFAGNTDSATFCIRCGSRLVDRDVTRKPVTSLLPPDQANVEPRIRDKHVGHLEHPDIALYIGDNETPSIVPLAHDLLLGRAGSMEMESGSFDLSQHQAIENGVSRKHAMLRRLGPDIVLLDLESTNGTWLNGVQLKGHQPVTIRSGDRLILGKLMIQVFLPS